MDARRGDEGSARLSPGERGHRPLGEKTLHVAEKVSEQLSGWGRAVEQKGTAQKSRSDRRGCLALEELGLDSSKRGSADSDQREALVGGQDAYEALPLLDERAEQERSLPRPRAGIEGASEPLRPVHHQRRERDLDPAQRLFSAEKSDCQPEPEARGLEAGRERLRSVSQEGGGVSPPPPRSS